MCQGLTAMRQDVTDKNHDLALMRQGVTHNFARVLNNHYYSIRHHKSKVYKTPKSSYYIY